MKTMQGSKTAKRALHHATALVLTAGLMVAGNGHVSARPLPHQASTRAQSPVTVTVWQGWSGDEAKQFHKLIARFNATHAAIHVTTLDNVDYQKLLTAISGGTPPDVAELFSDYIGTFAHNGVIQSLNELAKGAGIDTRAYTSQALSAGLYQGKLYGIPFLYDAHALYWNKDIFKQAGLDPNKPPQTLSQLAQLARKLEKVGSGGKILRLGIDPSGMFYALTWDYGGAFATAKGTKITANSPAAIKALQWELSFYKRLGAKNIAAFQSGEGQYASPANPFFRGQLAMTYDGEWLQAFVQRYAPQLHYGVAELPYPDGMPQVRGTTSLGGGLWVVPKGAKNPRAAMVFIKWLANTTSNQVAYANALANLPTLIAARESATFIRAHPYNRFFLALASGPHAHYFPATAITTQYETDLGKAEQDVLFGKSTPQKALAAVQSKDQKALDSALGKSGSGIP
jgi:multiple sugar transport system substrate-binding protein